MANVEMSYLLRLFELADSMLDDHDPANLTFGLGEPDADSSLARDDEGTRGYWVSIIVIQAIIAALDHAIALRDLIVGFGKVTHAAPWTILRGVLEPAALAVWVLNGSKRERRQERALRVWFHDYKEREIWERAVGDVVVPPAKSAGVRVSEVVAVAKSLDLRPTQVSTRLNYADVVADAGEVVGWKRGIATARWRESSGFAHGRFWPSMRLGDPQSAERIRGGYAIALTLGEKHHREPATLATDLLERALTDWAKASAFLVAGNA